MESTELELAHALMVSKLHLEVQTIAPSAQLVISMLVELAHFATPHVRAARIRPAAQGETEKPNNNKTKFETRKLQLQSLVAKLDLNLSMANAFLFVLKECTTMEQLAKVV